MIRKAIVSGANGFLGSHAVKYLLAKGVSVTALCRNGRAERLPQSDNLTICQFDLSKAAENLQMIDCDEYDVFFHFAWQGIAGNDRYDTILQMNNVQWTVETMRAAAKIGCKRFVCAGSIMEREALSLVSTQGCSSDKGSIYGGSKLLAHIMCKALAEEVGIELVWGLITNAYGPGEESPRLINTTLRKCINGCVPQFTSGTQNYDFVYIDDVARAFYLLAHNGRNMHEYVIGSSKARPLREFLLELQRTAAPGLEFSFGDVTFKGVGLTLEQLSCAETERHTGFTAKISFAEGIRRTKDWLEYGMRGEENSQMYFSDGVTYIL